VRRPAAPPAGLGSVENFLRGYEQTGGATVDRVAFQWWVVLATLRWGVICRYQAERNLSEQNRSAANVLRIVERELLVDSADDVADALAGVGFNDEAQLASAIRAGQLDGCSEHVRACLRALVSHRLSVAHPGYRNE